MVWAFGICGQGHTHTRNMFSIFGSWLDELAKKFKPLVHVAAVALCVGPFGSAETQWFFYNKQFSFLQVIFSATRWLRTWAILQRHTSQDILVAVSHFLAYVAKDLFARALRWWFSLRIDSISVLGFSSNFHWLCALSGEAENFSRRCITSM